MNPAGARGSIRDMSNSIYFHSHLHRRITTIVGLALAALLLSHDMTARAAVWNGIEPLKSRRADVERQLGKPVKASPGETGTLNFKVAGGTVTVLFVNAKFVATKKIAPELEGTVLQIVLQHERATDSPESLGLVNNSDFEREDSKDAVVYRNLKDGIFYFFVGGQLKTTRYAPPAEQLARVQKK